VWETFKADYELFEVDEDGRRVAPQPWASYGGRNPCGAAIDNRQKTIASFAPFADFNQPSFTVGAPANPLVAQNRAYTRYEIHFNEPDFSAFAASGWSLGLNLPDKSRPGRFPVGSIAVKAAWRPLTAADPPAVRARYYIERAEIVDVAKTLAAGRAVCSESDVALVGLHIAIKTKSRSQWIWSTFEHVDNVPPAGSRARCPGRGRSLRLLRPRAAEEPLAAVRHGRGPAGRLDEPAEARSCAGAGGAAPSDRPVDRGFESRPLGFARLQGNGVAALHAGPAARHYT
jgi:hypothetical protein